MYKMLVLPGDGIGLEVMAASVRVLREAADRTGIPLEISQDDVGGAAFDRYGTPLADKTLDAAIGSDAVLLGAVGGPKWDHVPREKRPEAGLLALRQGMGTFANLRPAQCLP